MKMNMKLDYKKMIFSIVYGVVVGLGFMAGICGYLSASYIVSSGDPTTGHWQPYGCENRTDMVFAYTCGYYDNTVVFNGNETCIKNIHDYTSVNGNMWYDISADCLIPQDATFRLITKQTCAGQMWVKDE